MAKNEGTLVIAQVKKYDDQDTFFVVAAEDTSVIEQNGVVGANVQEALENAVAASVVEDILYEDLYNGVDGLIDLAQLIPGRKYRITDFATTANIVHTSPVETVTGSTEVIVVTAITTSTLDKNATSETYPQDILHYNVTNSYGSITGRIIYREDTINNIIGHFDWRVCQIRLWQNPDTDAYTVATDNSGLSQDFLIVPASGVKALTIEADIENRPPKVCFQGNVNKVWIGPHQDLVVFVGGAQDVSIGSCVRYAFHSTCAQFNSTTAANQSQLIEFYGEVQSVDILSYVGRTIFQAAVSHCTLSNVYYNTQDIITETLPHSNESLGCGGTWSTTESLLTYLTGEGFLIVGQRYIITDDGNRLVEATTNSAYVEVEYGGIDLTTTVTIDLASNVVGLIVQSDAAQSANLQEWQDSAGNPLLTIDYSGAIEGPNHPEGWVYNAVHFKGDITLGSALLVNDAVPDTVILREAGYTVGFASKVNDSSNYYNFIWNTDTGTSGYCRWDVICGDYGAVGVYGGMIAYSENFAGGFANTFSVGASKNAFYGGGAGYSVYINDGDLRIKNNKFLFGFGSVASQLDPAGYVHLNGQTDEPILIVEGAAAQATNLQEWRNSAGTALSYVSADGAGTFPHATLVDYLAIGDDTLASTFENWSATLSMLSYKDINKNVYNVLWNRDTTGGGYAYTSLYLVTGDFATAGPIFAINVSGRGTTTAGQVYITGGGGITALYNSLPAAIPTYWYQDTVEVMSIDTLNNFNINTAMTMTELVAAPAAHASRGKIYYYNNTTVKRLAFKFPGDEEEVILAERAV